MFIHIVTVDSNVVKIDYSTTERERENFRWCYLKYFENNIRYKNSDTKYYEGVMKLSALLYTLNCRGEPDSTLHMNRILKIQLEEGNDDDANEDYNNNTNEIERWVNE